MGLSQFAGSSDFPIAPSVVILLSSFFKCHLSGAETFCISACVFFRRNTNTLKTSAKLCTMESTGFVPGLTLHMLYH